MAKNVIQVKKASTPVSPISTAERLIGELCYYYPQYTLAQARRLPFKHVILLLKIARRMKAQEYHTLTQIAAAPHTKNGEGVKKLMRRFESEAR